MGNNNSAISKSQHSAQREKFASIEPHYVVQRKLSTKPKVVSVGAYRTEQQGEKPLDNDVTFSNYIQRAKYKIRSLTYSGCHEEQSYPAPVDVTNIDTNNNSNENEKDPFSDFIQNDKKKIRTVSRKNSFSRRG